MHGIAHELIKTIFHLGLFTLGILLIVFKPPIKVGPNFQAKLVLPYEIIGGFVEVHVFFVFNILGSVKW